MRTLPWIALAAGGCATMSGARPLEPGQHAVGVTVGGGLISFAGAPVPLPNTVVEARHGLGRLADRPLDLSYGLNGTALAFGLVQGHVGSSWLMLEQHGGAPALSVTDRVFWATDLDGVWAADQVEVTASWLVGQQLVYGSLSEYLDLGNPGLVLTPAIGGAFDFAEPGGFYLQTEARWFGVHRASDLNTIPWLTNDATGVLGLTVGLGTRFGGAR